MARKKCYSSVKIWFFSAVPTVCCFPAMLARTEVRVPKKTVVAFLPLSAHPEGWVPLYFGIGTFYAKA